MFELFEIWRNNREDKKDFMRRTRIYMMDDVKIRKPIEWLQYAKYWKIERDALGHEIDDVGWNFAGEEVMRQYRLMDRFAGNVSDVLALFSDTIQPRTFDEFMKHGFD